MKKGELRTCESQEVEVMSIVVGGLGSLSKKTVEWLAWRSWDRYQDWINTSNQMFKREISKNEQGRFSPNFKNKTCDSWIITCDKLSKSTQG